jgi:hypothetical protein
MTDPVPRSAPRPAAAPPIEAAFARTRAELEIRTAFPDEVLDEARRLAHERVPTADATRADRTGVPFVTIDPPGSRDLDQAVHVARDGDGYRLRYAIADVGFFVDRGGAVEREAWRRGVTYYAPTGAIRSTRRCSPRARRACSPTARARRSCSSSCSTRAPRCARGRWSARSCGAARS